MKLSALKPSKIDVAVAVVALLIAVYDFSSRLILPESAQKVEGSDTQQTAERKSLEAQFNVDELLAYYQAYGGKDDDAEADNETKKKPEVTEAERIKQNDPWKGQGVVMGNFKYRLAGVFIDQARTAVLQSYSYEDGQRRVKAIQQGEKMGDIVVSEVHPKYIVLTLNSGTEAQTRRIDLFPQSGSDN